MRQPIHVKHFAPRSAQQGYALFIVLMIMIVIALLVVTAVQSYNTEQRISANEADRKLAHSLAEAALQKGENKILEFYEKKVVFSENCVGSIGGQPHNGLCATPNAVVPASIAHALEVAGKPQGNAWERGNGNQLHIDTNGHKVAEIRSEDVDRAPRYIIEYISADLDHGSVIYRITAKAWGKNRNTAVMLQSYIENK